MHSYNYSTGRDLGEHPFQLLFIIVESKDPEVTPSVTYLVVELEQSTAVPTPHLTSFPMFQATLGSSRGRGIWFNSEGRERGRVTCEAVLQNSGEAQEAQWRRETF